MRTETIVIVVGKLRAGVGWHCLQWWWSLRTASASPFTYRRAQFKYRKRYLLLGKRLFSVSVFDGRYITLKCPQHKRQIQISEKFFHYFVKRGANTHHSCENTLDY